ncbi:MAG: hypothetical protein E7315_04190 [Clostridiales bacterium]|nr:hypothetical protein [Clostridiales bacterium]
MEERFFKLNMYNEIDTQENTEGGSIHTESTFDNTESIHINKNSTYLKSFVIRCIISAIIIACIYGTMSFQSKNNAIFNKISDAFTVEYKIEEGSWLEKIAEHIESAVNSISNKINGIK